MNLGSRDERKKLGYVRFINSFKYSFQGIIHAVKNEQSVLVMVICTVLAVTFGFLLKISMLEWFFILIAIGLVLGTELLNTAIEATMDLLSQTYHPLAKVAKDTASASVFVYSIIAFIIGCLVFIPKVIDIIERM